MSVRAGRRVQFWSSGRGSGAEAILIVGGNATRPDTRLPKSPAGGQGLYLRSPDHLGRSIEVKKIKS